MVLIHPPMWKINRNNNNISTWPTLYFSWITACSIEAIGMYMYRLVK